MSTDPKKLVKTILLSYFLAAISIVSAFTCKDVPILLLSFVGIGLLVIICACLSLNQQYKKYKIQMYLFLEIIGIIFGIFSILMTIIYLK